MTSDSLIKFLANKATLARYIVEKAATVDGGRAAFHHNSISAGQLRFRRYEVSVIKYPTEMKAS
jgi:hypothetical protein